MKRTFNYTGRKRILQEDVTFSLLQKPGQPPEFEAVFKSENSTYPPSATLYIEAYHKETRQRFDFGRASFPVRPTSTSLDQLDLTGPVLFRILVVDEEGSHGRLLASGEKFRARNDGDDDSNHSSLLTIVQRPLGQIPWKLDFSSDNPELIINSAIPDAIGKMKHNPVFQALVLPAALREILVYYLWDEAGDSEEESDSGERWLNFAEMIFEKRPEGKDPEDLMDWVDNVINEFSNRFNMCDRLVHEFTSEDE